MTGLPNPRLNTQRLQLSLPSAADADEYVAYLVRNREHLAPWSPPEPTGALTPVAIERRIAAARRSFENGSAVNLLLRRHEPHGATIVGFVSLSQICLGAFRACYLGYHLDAAHVGQGYMTEALRAAIRYAFDERKLHRIMANYLPENERSARVLARLGFEIEGYARNYLFIAGAFRDHVLTALTHPDLPNAQALCTPSWEQ